MTMRKLRVLLVVLASVCVIDTFAQKDTSSLADTADVAQDWFLKDPEVDRYQGTSTEKTYATLLQGKPSKKIRVAVIDSGIDIDHEDLKDVIWTNDKEVKGNGIDDDKNGYVDDIHGWNFIGGKSGSVNADTYEVTREYTRLKPLYDSIDEKKIKKKDRAEYELWKVVKTEYEKELKSNQEQFDVFSQQYSLYVNAFRTLSYCDSIVSTSLGVNSVSKSSLSSLTTANDTVLFAKETLLKVLENVEGDIMVADFLEELRVYIDDLQEGVDHFKAAVEFGYNTEYNSRLIVGDNPNDPYEKNYGNNDVKGGDAKHGTHVAGIIGANRKNDIGVKGIADNVEIIAIRVVPPNGDERDKDIANGIIYAVDNGAQIINMSFGKDYSPHKEAVDKAVKYAEQKGVLLMHAAGNEGENLDNTAQFPTRQYKNKKVAQTWMEIGASSWGKDSSLVASFSNYGKKTVDLFAPGVEIYSTTPGNTYEDLQGTSMACPIASGVAALVWSYFPDLTATQIREVLNQSSRRFDGLKVTQPGSSNTVPFNQLSITGGMVNAYEAIKLAQTIKFQAAKK
ncbi:S8 family peptidase [Chryseolinea sp. H1M3-3]|uniref:S8 family peptidase n=1 Tax=Chryseolinea sp. H1M3-3 TaxID=3034144 RepID=UPI0023ECD47A|nr:S8 family peptidase [Chryseolinea sp. H1M3-3]